MPCAKFCAGTCYRKMIVVQFRPAGHVGADRHRIFKVVWWPGKSGHALCVCVRGGGGGEEAFQERVMLDLSPEAWLKASQGRKMLCTRDSFSLWCLLED